MSTEKGLMDYLTQCLTLSLSLPLSLCVCVSLYFHTKIDSINGLLKGAVMTKACEETKHFYSDHSQAGTCCV